jgi:ABC-type enterochelin transport system substrate-binding protein
MSVTKEQLKQEIDSLNEPDFEQIYPLIQQLIEKCKRQEKTTSLFDELAEIKLDAPKDFAANFDRYSGSEKQGGV